MDSEQPRDRGVGRLRREPEFRSHAEAQIGRCFTRHGIDYFYEHPLAVVDRQQVRIWYPDFQLPGYAIVIEYGGRLDDPDYAARWHHKHHVYAANGIDALMLSRRDLDGDWPNRLLDRIDHLLEERLSDFRRHRGAISYLEPSRQRSAAIPRADSRDRL